MIKLDVELMNLTTDEETIRLKLPMDKGRIKSQIIDGCDYLVVINDYDIFFKNDNVFSINETLQKINDNNPGLTTEFLCTIFKTGMFEYADDDSFVEKICDNDFMMVEFELPYQWKDSAEHYAAYILLHDYNVPFSLFEEEINYVKQLGRSGGYWDYVWGVYTFMGFALSEKNDKGKYYIINVEDAE